MAKRHQENREESYIVRGRILEALQAQVDRERNDQEGTETYLDEDLLYVMVAKRYPQLRSKFRGELYYLKDMDCVKLKEVKVGAEKSLMWRITAKGRDVLDGTAQLAGVVVD